jgi:hypothetical protein
MKDGELLAEAGDQPFSHAAEVRHIGMSERWRTTVWIILLTRPYIIYFFRVAVIYVTMII